MCDVNRRAFLAGGAAFLSLATEVEGLAHGPGAEAPGAGGADVVAPDVYFHVGTVSGTADAVCNNGWIVFEDYVLVIDANFPAGARQIIGKIRALTDKPIRFALDTHHHGDHAYGNQVFVENGAVPIAHAGVVEEMKRLETGYYGGKPGAWEEAAKGRSDLKTGKLKPPSVLFSGELVFDDGKHRVELLHLGVAHTRGDTLAWLPAERILFTGDVCVNGPFNYMGDGDTRKWIATLEAARKLGARIVCTGHGPRSAATVLDDQRAFFEALVEHVEERMAPRSPEEARSQVEPIRASLRGNPQIARYVGEAGAEWDPFPSQVEKVYQEQSGRRLTSVVEPPPDARRAHARAHGLALG
jgi:glyoxylase-like metal-dependent hydrolase (beta-lactamase superfamily II)